MKNFLFYCAILTAVLVSCKDNTDKLPVATKEEVVKLKITAYSQDYELYAEADPLVVGQPSNVLSHFSRLPGFKAMETGSITIRLIVGNSEVNQTLEKPTRKGIFSFELTPKDAGQGKLVFDIIADGIQYQLVVPDITVFAEKSLAKEAAKKQSPSMTNCGVFTKEQSWKIDFATEQPALGSFGQIIKTTGRIEAAPGDEQVIVAGTSGTVTFTAAKVLEGIRVRKGDVLFKITASGLADNNSAVRFAEATANYEKAKAELERAEILAKDKIVSDKDLLKARTDFNNANAVYENLNKNFNASGQTVKSPGSGYVQQMVVRNGQFVQSGQVLAVVSQNKSLLIRAEVQQKYAPLLESLISATIRTSYDDKTYTLEELKGKILSFGRSTDPDNFLIPINLEIENLGTLIPGAFVELNLKTASAGEVITVPDEAIMEDQGILFLFVQVNPELFEKRAVKTGISDGIRTQILEGISVSDRVVTRGAIFVKLAQASGVLDPASGHNH